jgi:hypothetical protein
MWSWFSRKDKHAEQVAREKAELRAAVATPLFQDTEEDYQAKDGAYIAAQQHEERHRRDSFSEDPEVRARAQAELQKLKTLEQEVMRHPSMMQTMDNAAARDADSGSYKPPKPKI